MSTCQELPMPSPELVHATDVCSMGCALTFQIIEKFVHLQNPTMLRSMDACFHTLRKLLKCPASTQATT